MPNISYFFEPVTWFTFLIGAIIGSFLNVCIFRIPEKTFFQNSRSLCRNCNTQIPAFHNIPILSFLILRGRASCCNAKLSWQYPVVELFTGLMMVCCYWRYPFLMSYAAGDLQVDHAHLLRFLHLSLFTCLMIVCSVIDIREMIIPDVISLPMIAATPLVVYFHPDLTMTSALIGVIIGGGSLYLIAWLYWLVRREIGLGFGDVKLLAAIGGWLGFEAVMPSIFFASISGSIVGLALLAIRRSATMKMAIPFGPFLAAGAVLHMFVEMHRVISWDF
jgi:leader peptidase (prepilin peptidase)/N-methyltransferase